MEKWESVARFGTKEDMAYIEDLDLWTMKEVRQIGHSAWLFRRNLASPPPTQHHCACTYVLRPHNQEKTTEIRSIELPNPKSKFRRSAKNKKLFKKSSKKQFFIVTFYWCTFFNFFLWIWNQRKILRFWYPY